LPGSGFISASNACEHWFRYGVSAKTMAIYLNIESISLHCFRIARESLKEVTMKIYRRTPAIMALLTLSLAVPGLSAAQSNQDSGHGISQIESATPGVHDFDFLVGHWRVHHRKLKERLANNHEWIEFEGTLNSQPLMGSYGNVDDLVLEVPGADWEPRPGVATTMSGDLDIPKTSLNDNTMF
jgi:hypothetical protein